MIYKDYGSTGKKVSALGFGGMRFRDDDSIQQAAEAVRRASALGVNYFDTAPYYCHDRSEDIFGEAFKDMPNEFYVSTKCGENNGPAMRKSLERSLDRLGVERINFFHVWCVLNMERYERVKAEGALDELYRAQEEGLVEHIVISSHQPGEEIRRVLEEGHFEGITLGYNIVNFPFRQEGLEAAKELGLGVATMNPLSGGLIPQNEQYFSFLRERPDLTSTASALRFNAGHPEISVTLAGMGTIEEVEQNVAAMEGLEMLTGKRLEELRSHAEITLDGICTGCSYCIPCPNEIPIPKFMDAYNYKLLDSEKEAGQRLKYHWGIDPKLAGDCDACAQCETLCTQSLPIIDRLKEMAGI